MTCYRCYRLLLLSRARARAHARRIALYLNRTRAHVGQRRQAVAAVAGNDIAQLRNDEGWIPCPTCAQPLVEEVSGTFCAGCPRLWIGEW